MTSSPGVAASSSRRDNRGWWLLAAVTAQAGILFVTFMMGLGWGGVLWIAALAQAAAGIVFLAWLDARGYGPALLAVPVVSLALMLGLAAASNTGAVACSDRALAAFEQLPPPPGVSVETFVGFDGCMAETSRVQQAEDLAYRSEPGAEVYAHYRSEFKKHGWRIVSDGGGGLRAERNDVYIHMHNADGRVYFTLGEH
jgi:hypothetical protein